MVHGLKHCRLQNKIRFDSERQALAYRGFYLRAGIPVKRVYQCPSCHDWHWTSEEKKDGEPSQ